jgi:hypothetical protein
MANISLQFDGAGPENADRAEFAMRALRGFCEEVGLDEAVERHAAVSDLICNLGHFCDRHGLDFLSVASGAIGVWDAEKREEENGESNALYPERRVVISICDAGTRL